MSTWINPTSRDYSVVAGLLERGEEAVNAILIALTVERGSVPGLPTMGSELHTLRRDTKNIALKARTAADKALLPLLQTGLLQSAATTVEIQSGRLAIQVDYVAQGRRHRFNFFVPVK